VRYEIAYRSDYRYDGPVAGNLNRLRMRPSDGGTQRTEHFDVRVAPDALRHDHRDLFGNHVVEVLVAAPHQELRIEVDALVATTDPLPSPQGGWPDLRTEEYRAVAGVYRYDVEPQPDPGPLQVLLDLARQDTPAATVDRVMTLVPERFTYTPGATTVDTTVEEFVAGGAGVCQDFAHLAARLLRACDIAARYVSGYFFTTPDAGGESAEVDTHAWVEALLPVAGESAPVWHGVDPTNGIAAGHAHVKIGHGRFYGDVPPVEGSFSGAASSTVDAHVSMRRLAG
jgi:transglutaminase-like putative cysteine protease